MTDMKKKDIDLENLSFGHDSILTLASSFQSKIPKDTTLDLMLCKLD